ncbi:Glycoprotein 3-alpha-L-fucosyltransferase A [Mizuhopecten yessoensis]|uniref:Fucosyltransferase n=1 Tax=Mizuhopecten yessoensis TaxID=6573 RepID=A0A210QK69_MIZYE|nr:Glycoprotein 3-alpha-L-fucosyltransferase A [Mizuhopecten yessoensis]
MVVAVISDCTDDAGRYRYLNELGKHVTIDYFGNCGNLYCPLGPTAECNSPAYKFRTAFENSNCKDYVTEKFWKSLEQNVIPIVNWKSDQVIKVPENSYINMYDFQSAKELGAYLNRLDYWSGTGTDSCLIWAFKSSNKYTKRSRGISLHFIFGSLILLRMYHILANLRHIKF